MMEQLIGIFIFLFCFIDVIDDLQVSQHVLIDVMFISSTRYSLMTYGLI